MSDEDTASVFKLVDLAQMYKVKEGFGNQINLCRDRGWNPGPPAQKSDTLPLDHQVTHTTAKIHRSNIGTDYPEQYFRATVAIPLLDDLIAQMKSWFTDHKKVLFNLYNLL
uniref:Uncharacterized protein n=1 Tax=Timema bartmani TaxID=61472 RepID=A0A7R9EV89_9NEOP|nr:unnamed protein product [Timema bartmani]